jgi:hypothetical protein
MAVNLAEKAGVPPDFDDDGFQDRLLRHLYQQLVKWTETTVRHAVRLDKPIDGEEIQADDHPALRSRTDDDRAPQDPLAILMVQEEAAKPTRTLTQHESRAAAYYHLLERCDSSMRIAAEVLRISVSYCYFRFNEAKRQVGVQDDLRPIVGDSSFRPGAWRPFKMTPNHQWRQLPLNFTVNLF